MTPMPSLPPYSEVELHPYFLEPIEQGALTLEEALMLWACEQAGWTMLHALLHPPTRLAALSLQAWDSDSLSFRQ